GPMQHKPTKDANMLRPIALPPEAMTFFLSRMTPSTTARFVRVGARELRWGAWQRSVRTEDATVARLRAKHRAPRIWGTSVPRSGTPLQSQFSFSTPFQFLPHAPAPVSLIYKVWLYRRLCSRYRLKRFLHGQILGNVPHRLPGQGKRRQYRDHPLLRKDRVDAEARAQQGWLQAL